MERSAPAQRRVYVLGRRDKLDVEAAARKAAADGVQLVLLTLGYPVTHQQQEMVRRGLDAASELRIWFDAVFATSASNAAELATPAETVTIVAGGRERKELQRAMTAQGVPLVNGALEPASRDRWPPPVSVTPASLAPTGANHDEQRGTEPQMPEAAEPTPLDLGSESVEALAGRQIATAVLDTVVTFEQTQARKRAPLRVYLGAAPGVGKTFAMLSEGQRRRARGTDVVVGVIQTYDRPATIEMLEGLEVLEPRRLEYRGATFDEMDVDALIGRHPEVALIDELAHTNIPGSTRAKRWEDVVDVLAEGIEVITTLNVQHIVSLNDVVATTTGIRQQETVPDWILDVADQVELVDMSPHALQRRMLHGNVYPDPRTAELALQRYFTTENLTALRELALMRVANQVDDDLLRRWSKAAAPETRERILVCIARPDLAEGLIRRGSRMTHRAQGDLLVVHVQIDEDRRARDWLGQIQRLVAELGGQFEVLSADDPVEAVLSYAHRHRVTQIVVGESLRPRWRELIRGSFATDLIRTASNVDVHVIARGER